MDDGVDRDKVACGSDKDQEMEDLMIPKDIGQWVWFLEDIRHGTDDINRAPAQYERDGQDANVLVEHRHHRKAEKTQKDIG